jgi:undecaprenyl pyrophosphate synthase
MRLSTEAPVEQDGVPVSTASGAETQQRINAEAQERINAEAQERINAEAQKADDAPKPKRINRGYQLREDLVKALKRVALDEDRNLYEVMEEAFEQYLAQR